MNKRKTLLVNRSVDSVAQEDIEESNPSGQNYLQQINDLIKMTENKKVNQNNAFDVKLTTYADMKEFMKTHDKLEQKWTRTGEALGAGAKVYGFRVDNVHTETYKMMSCLNRNQNGVQEIELLQGED